MRKISRAELGALRRTRPRLWRLLTEPGLTTPLLREFTGEDVIVSAGLVRGPRGWERSYVLRTTGGLILEAGVVRCLTPGSQTILQIDRPLGPWALENGYECGKTGIIPVSAGRWCEVAKADIALRKRGKVYGRRYVFTLRKNNERHDLFIREFWNPEFF